MNVPFVDLKAQYLSIKEEIDSTIQNVLDTCGFIMGPNVKEFEAEFAKFCNAKFCIGAGSGSQALDLITNALDLKGGEVITVPNTFIATTESITHGGANIKFVDIDKDTFNIDTDKIEAAITPKTKAIMPVHLYGQFADMKLIMEIAEKHNLRVIEDAAQAHAAEYQGKRAPFGDIAAYSFFPGKNMGCYGDGGAVVTNDEEIAEKCAMLRIHGSRQKYIYDMEGFGYRLDALQAAVLRVKLKYIEEWTNKRRAAAKLYNDLLTDVTTPVEASYGKSAYHLYVIRTKEREKLMSFLKEKGIASGLHYPYPLHLTPAYAHLNIKEGAFPVAEEYSSQILSLPMFPEITEEQITYVADNIKEYFKR